MNASSSVIKTISAVKVSAIGLCLFGLVQTSAHANKDTKAILGIWQTYDDKTNHKKAQVTISYDKRSGTYVGRITKITPVPGYKPKKTCQNCPPPFTGKKIKGMAVLWNLKPQVNAKGEFTGEYVDGYLIDPLSGNIYRGQSAVSNSGKILKLRGYVGITLMGRTQTWKRVK